MSAPRQRKLRDTIQPLGSFHNTGIYSGNHIRAYGDGSTLWRFQTQPIVWESGRGGGTFDPVLRAKLEGVNEQTRKAIKAFWKEEAKTERQLRWNKQTQTNNPVPGYREMADRTYFEYARDFKNIQTEVNWLVYGVIGLGIGMFFLG